MTTTAATDAPGMHPRDSKPDQLIDDVVLLHSCCLYGSHVLVEGQWLACPGVHGTPAEVARTVFVARRRPSIHVSHVFLRFFACTRTRAS